MANNFNVTGFIHQHWASASIGIQFFPGDFENFCFAGVTSCTNGSGIWVEGRLLHAKCHPHGCWDEVGVWGPAKKLKILTNFCHTSIYKRVTLAHPLHDFYKLFTDCGELRARSCDKIKESSLKLFWSYQGFNLRGSGHPHIFSTPQQRNYVSDPKRFRVARTCSRSSIIMPSVVRLGIHTEEPKMLSFLSVCLSCCCRGKV